jgi:hypothetical protein
LWSYQKVFYGDITVEKNKTLADISVRELAILGTMAVITLWMGIGSTFITGRTATASQSVIDQMKRPQHAEEVLIPAKPAAQPAATQPVNATSNSLASAPNAAAAAKQNSLERLGTR